MSFVQEGDGSVVAGDNKQKTTENQSLTQGRINMIEYLNSNIRKLS